MQGIGYERIASACAGWYHTSNHTGLGVKLPVNLDGGAWTERKEFTYLMDGQIGNRNMCYRITSYARAKQGICERNRLRVYLPIKGHRAAWTDIKVEISERKRKLIQQIIHNGITGDRR